MKRISEVHRADINARDNEDRTLADQMLQAGRTDVVEFLPRHFDSA